MFGYNHNMFGFGGFWMIIFWIVIIVILVWLIKFLVGKSSSSENRDREDGASAMEILKRRYASGEISKAEFEQKKKDLTT